MPENRIHAYLAMTAPHVEADAYLDEGEGTLTFRSHILGNDHDGEADFTGVDLSISGTPAELYELSRSIDNAIAAMCVDAGLDGRWVCPACMRLNDGGHCCSECGGRRDLSEHHVERVDGDPRNNDLDNLRIVRNAAESAGPPAGGGMCPP